MLETLEHLHEPRAVAMETARVLQSGGALLVTTPPRWRYAFAPDPHFGIRGLVVLPPRLQRLFAARRGFSRADHYVHKIYGSTKQVAWTFRELALRSVLSRSRTPKRWFWDAILFLKK